MAIVLDGNLGITTPSETNTGTLSVTGVTTLTGGLNAALPVLSGGTGVTTSTGSGAGVHATSPTITGATITVAATAAPAFSAYQSSAQSITLNIATKVTFTSEEFDTNNNFSSSTFTPTVAGYYQITAYFAISGTATSAQVRIYKNGSLFKFTGINITSNQIGGTVLIYCNGSTDYIEIYAYISASVTLVADQAQTYFQAAMIRSA